MDSLIWFFFESTLALAGVLVVLLFVLLVHWRRGGRPRPLLIGLSVAILLLIVQALVVTRREHADRILRRIETDVVASRTDAIAAALSARFHVAEPDMDQAGFLERVRRAMRRVDVRTLTQHGLKIQADESDTFEVSVTYWADVSTPEYGGLAHSRWRIVFIREQGNWRILTVEPTELNRLPVAGWSGVPHP
jgi:hypothetical protein